MAATAHVPKFGDWEHEDIAYTACFDEARQSKPAAGAKFNPNDPEDNPEAFMAMMAAQRRARESEKVNADPHPVDHQHGARNQRGTNNIAGFTSEPSAERSSTSADISLRKKNRQNDRSHRSDTSSSRSDHGHRRHRRGSSTSNQSFDHGSSSNQHRFQESVSVPKFGSWDVKDPKSGEAFTSIFDKVKEQNQIESSAAYMVTNVPKPPKDQSKRDRPCMSKICCCLFSN